MIPSVSLTSATVSVHAGGVASGVDLASNEYETVYAGGTASTTTVESGGQLTVSSGGTDNNTVVNNGGREYVSSRGTTNATVVNSGGREDRCPAARPTPRSSAMVELSTCLRAAPTTTRSLPAAARK